MIKSLKNISLVIISVGFCILILEICLRVLGPRTTNVKMNKEIYQKDDLVGYIHKPNVKINQATDEWDIIIQSNSDGLRNNRDYEKGQHKNIIRILGLGDSFTWGEGVNIQDTYLKVLEKKLNSKNFGGDIKYEVINAAFGGWGIGQEFLYLKSRGYEYEPDLIILGFIADDIFRNIKYYDKIFSPTEVKIPKIIIEKPKHKLLIRIKDYLLANTRLYPFLSSRISQISWLNDYIYYIGLREKGNVNDSIRDKKFINQSIEMGKNIFLKIKNYCDEKKIKLIVVIIPSDVEKTMITNDTLGKINKIIIKFLLEKDTHVVNLTNAFSNSSKQLYFLRDRHPNSNGHRIIASGIYMYLEKNKIVYTSGI